MIYDDNMMKILLVRQRVHCGSHRASSPKGGDHSRAYSNVIVCFATPPPLKRKSANKTFLISKTETSLPLVGFSGTQFFLMKKF